MIRFLSLLLFYNFAILTELKAEPSETAETTQLLVTG